ncbi:MAG: bifunctional DNA-formamidopyrimidine glycosylase/DNA-(apurinic or apyrimidinic site) lyase [Firmicutes bacterium]|nr:bifunctional DNA-formamidopyrimidine glycosylase/DNA-(apurinic or apyrimidinic site) lyase [Bacillota bacterium]
MPELPETETIKRELEQTVIGLRITGVEVPVPMVLRVPVDEFKKQITGTIVTGAARRAKNIILHLSNNKAILFHLMISGTLLYLPADAPLKEKTQVIFRLNNGYELRYRDPRLFGYVKLLSESDISKAPELSHLGPEPLSEDFTFERFREMLKRRPRSRIKALLLDQSFIAGIGNIYADEILFYARVLPTRRAGTLTDEELKRMYEGMRSILTKAIEERGTSIISYVDLFGRKGNYKNFLKVHARAGKPCLNGCTGTVVKTEVAGRGTYYCPSCQK